MSVPIDKTTFTLAEAAELLSCHRETLRNAIRRGRLKAAKLGRQFRISRLELETFWVSSGGGELFSGPAEGAEQPASLEKPQTPERNKGGKRELQFPLPGTGKRASQA